MDKVSRALFLENRAAQVQAEREAAAKAVEAADKSNKASEKAFVTGSVKGVGASIAEGAGWVIDVLMSNPKYQFGSEQLTSFETDLRTYFDSKMQDKPAAEREGYDAGKVFGQFIDPGPGAELGAVAAGVKKAKKVLTREEEIVKLATEQAADAHAWMKRGGEPPLFDQYGVRPGRIGEKQESAFPSKKSEPIYEMQDEHPVLVGDKENMQMLEYSQAQHNPGATSGLPPQKPAQFGETMETVSTLASARTARWKGGKFDAQVAEQQWAKAINLRKAEAAKSSGEGAAKAAERSPKYWVLDESDRTIYEVSLNKHGEVGIRRSNADWRWKDPETKEYIRDQDGRIMARPEIDEIVPQDAKAYLESKIKSVQE